MPFGLCQETPEQCTYSGCESSVLVRKIHFGPGLRAVIEKGSWIDPSVAYRIDEKGRKPLRPTEGRQIWRDTGPLALLREKDFAGDAPIRFERPLACHAIPAITRFRRVIEIASTLR